jgi:RNA polymerase sigma-70 factor (ECF subfamily)
MSNPTDIAIFNKLFNDYYRQFVRFAMGYIKDEAKAQDFVSDAFASYWEKVNLLPEETNAPGYILTIVRNNCLNYLQHKKIKQRTAQELTNHAQWVIDTQINTLEACDPDKIFSEEIEIIIEKTINKLPERTAQIFKMSRFEHLSHRDIAEELSLTTKSVEYHITKTLNELRINLKDFLTILVLFCIYF